MGINTWGEGGISLGKYSGEKSQYIGIVELLFLRPHLKMLFLHV